jgi:hypothetical protein
MSPYPLSRVSGDTLLKTVGDMHKQYVFGATEASVDLLIFAARYFGSA